MPLPKARHLEAMLLPGHALDAFAYRRVNEDGSLIRSTIIRRRRSLLTRILHTGSYSRPTSISNGRITALSHKKNVDIVTIY